MSTHTKSSHLLASSSDKTTKRLEIAGRVADIMLTRGLNDFGLRGLASQLGTSDRMLLYYFGTKDRLVVDALANVSERLTLILRVFETDERLTPGQFLKSIFAIAEDEHIAPFVRLWTEVIARAARGEHPYDQVGKTVVHGWTTWIESRLVPSESPYSHTRAAAILSIVEGISLLELAAPSVTPDTRAYFVGLFDEAE